MSNSEKPKKSFGRSYNPSVEKVGAFSERQSSKILVVDSATLLPKNARDGFLYAHARDTNFTYIWNGYAWVTLASGGGNSIRPVSIHNPRTFPSTYDDEFDTPAISSKWTRLATGTTVVSGTVFPFNTVTPDCIQDYNSTWPGWLLLQSDESTTQTVEYYQSWTATTDATFIVGTHYCVQSGGFGTGENEIRIKLWNSGDSNEWVWAAIGYTATGRVMRLQVNNNGALTTRNGAVALGAYSGLAPEALVLFKDGDEYNCCVTGDYGSYLGDLTLVTKTGVTTFDRVSIEFTTANDTPSAIMGVDYFRVYNSLTWALKNP